MIVETYRPAYGWRWRLKSRGRIVAESAETYATAATLRRALRRLQEAAAAPGLVQPPLWYAFRDACGEREARP